MAVGAEKGQIFKERPSCVWKIRERAPMVALNKILAEVSIHGAKVKTTHFAYESAAHAEYGVSFSAHQPWISLSYAVHSA